jgi:hypothetical protein
VKTLEDFVRCYQCERGGNGKSKDKCACGWTIKSKNDPRGCFIGEKIVKEPK